MKYLAMFPSWLPMMRFIPKDRLLSFMGSLVEYATSGHEPAGLTDAEQNVFDSVRIDIDRSRSMYDRRCEVMRRNGRRGGLAKRLNRQASLASEINDADVGVE